MNRKNEWIQLVTGKKFYPFNPRPEDIDIESIAHGLANMCRFNGQCLEFYSVAQHCVVCARMAKPEHKLALLLHDASEAVLSDITRPVKRHLSEYRELEKSVSDMLAEKFGVASFDFPELHEIDGRVLMTEKRDLMSPSSEAWSVPFEAYPMSELLISAWTPPRAKELFLKMFYNLTYKHGTN
jgi:hypothetical protein